MLTAGGALEMLTASFRGGQRITVPSAQQPEMQ